MKFLISLLFLPQILLSQTLRINEFSNGPSGAKEWIEILVVPTSPTIPSLKTCFYNSIDVAGWIIDDNNGDFSPIGQYSGTGIADGHLRFKNVAPWTRLPVGSLIVIYNSFDKDPLIPPDDRYDFNNDCVYILPDSSSLLEYCSISTPRALSCTTRTNYTDCSGYLNYNGTAIRSWSSVSLANAGDGLQIRDVSFNLIHGVVYGRTTLSSCGPNGINLIGGPSSPYVSTSSGVNTFYAYDGLDIGGYYDATKWITGSASLATPGSYNGINNQIWILDTIRKGCICDVTLKLDTTKYITQQSIKPFKIYQTNTSIVFNFDKMYRVEFILYSLSGQMINKSIKNIKGEHVYMYTKGNYFLTIIVENSMGFFYRKTLKIFN